MWFSPFPAKFYSLLNSFVNHRILLFSKKIEIVFATATRMVPMKKVGPYCAAPLHPSIEHILQRASLFMASWSHLSWTSIWSFAQKRDTNFVAAKKSILTLKRKREGERHKEWLNRFAWKYKESVYIQYCSLVSTCLILCPAIDVVIGFVVFRVLSHGIATKWFTSLVQYQHFNAKASDKICELVIKKNLACEFCIRDSAYWTRVIKNLQYAWAKNSISFFVLSSLLRYQSQN